MDGVRMFFFFFFLSENLPQKSEMPHHRLTTTPWRRELAGIYSSSPEEQQELESSLYPHLEPPQSSLTRSPARVMPYRSHVQLADGVEL
jgi:hypothetical protein